MALDPGDVRATNNIGVCLLAEGDAAQAERWFEKALQLDPSWTDSLFNLAGLRLERGDLAGVAPLVTRLAQSLPDDDEVKRLQARLRAGMHKGFKMEAPKPRAPGEPVVEVNPALRRLAEELAGNPRALFISYAWPDPATKAFAARIARGLEQHSYRVILDQDLELEVHEVLYLLAHCQNVLVLSDAHYAESCLLGLVPITHQTSSYPPTRSEEYLLSVFKLSAVAWEMARVMKSHGKPELDALAFELAAPEAFQALPGLRVFIEGWRVDEIQMVFSSLDRLRSISVAYLGGQHCLAGYPLFDFSHEAYYPISFSALLRVLEIGKTLTVDHRPIPLDVPDRSNYRWPESSIVSAKMWKIAKDEVTVWRPSLTPSGEAAALIQNFKDWEPAT